MTRHLGWACAALLCAACGGALPQPSISSVQPAEVTQGDASQLTVKLDAVLPFDVDYGSRSARVNPNLTLTLGDQVVEGAVLHPDQTLTAAAPLGLAPGTFDVSVHLADGRGATLPGGLTVKPGVFPLSFTIDPIPDQRPDRPFPITIRAVGGQGDQFGGVVKLTASRGTVTPAVSGSFSAGLLTETVSVDTASSEMVITVTDAVGHTGRSNAFRVAN